MLGVKFREGFMKNRYIGRTFIMPGQQQRKNQYVRNSIRSSLSLKAKTSCWLMTRLYVVPRVMKSFRWRVIQVQKVYFASAAPMVKYPNVYGIDMPAKTELIASQRSVEEIQEIIGADRLIFQDLDDLKSAVRTTKVPDLREFDCSVFDGVYVTGGIDHTYLENLEQKRNDTAKKKSDGYIDVNIDAASVDLTGIHEH